MSDMQNPFRFQHSIIDLDAGYDGWGGVVVADFDGDGLPEYATGGKGGGFYFIYDFDPQSGIWSRHLLTSDLNPHVGAAAADIDGDGYPEIVFGEWGTRLFWIKANPGAADFGSYHVIGDFGLHDPHDIIAADLDSDGKPEIVVREKNGRLLLLRIPENPFSTWMMETVAPYLPGDGTTAAALSGGKGQDLVTNAGWFENVHGDASEWRFHELIPSELDWHPESRIAVADVDGDEELEIVITESEIAHARLAVLKRSPSGSWSAQIIIPPESDYRALHSLQIVDLDGDGKPEIFTAEMENGKTDGVDSKPRWICLSRGESGEWIHHLLLDTNLGTHCAMAADFNGDGRIDLLGKVWRPNKINGVSGKHHVDVLWNRAMDASEDKL
ncbi:MAG: hypothetical protein K0R57_6034 [Paenibacillaceae bacterium]|jgi:hypothetical protein|nr:hypothetical protein [Paenibacillaceae bacterium]